MTNEIPICEEPNPMVSPVQMRLQNIETAIHEILLWLDSRNGFTELATKSELRKIIASFEGNRPT